MLLMKTTAFSFGKFHFLLGVRDMLEQKRFLLHSILISTQPNDLPTNWFPLSFQCHNITDKVLGVQKTPNILRVITHTSQNVQQ